jgi:hypothetical protein
MLQSAWEERLQQFRPVSPSLYRLTCEMYDEQCDTEHVIIETEAGTWVKEQQRLKFRRGTQHLQTNNSKV